MFGPIPASRSFLRRSGSTAGGADKETPPVRLLVPAYFYPSGEGLAAWKRMMEFRGAPIVAIVNPDSGPGKKADENYREIFGSHRNRKSRS